MSDSRRILALDYGSVRVGVAVSDPLGIIATGLTTLPNDNTLLDAISRLIAEYDIRTIVVGKPLTLKGETGKKALEVEEFLSHLRSHFTGEIISFDERFTSVIAHNTIREMGMKKRKKETNKGKVDQIAASIILQNYLDMRRT